MRVLIDSHALIYWLLEPKKLGVKGKALFSDPDSLLLVSVMTLLEIQFLVEIKRVELDFAEVLSFLSMQLNFEVLPFSEKICLECLPLDTRDPFDRVILASAISERAPILSRDRWMKSNYDQVIW